jgi:hypothetical protein
MRLSWTRWLRMHHNYGRTPKTWASDRAMRRAQKKRIKTRQLRQEGKDLDGALRIS